jgi:glutamine synthetase
VDTSVEESLIGKLSDLLSKAYSATLALEKAEAAARAKETDEQRAMSYKDVVLPKMEALRRAVDGMEVLTAREYWPVPTYGDLTYRV